MNSWNRREVLTTLGFGTAGLLVSRPAAKRAQPAANDGLGEFAGLLRQTTRAEVFNLAPAITYLPTPADPDTETRERSLHALRKAGVG